MRVGFTITGPVRPDRVNVNNNAGNTITLVGSATGSIEGAPLIEKSGTGKLVIALDNPLVAPAGVDVLAGELQLGNGGNAGSLGTALLFADANTVVSLDFGSAKTLWNTFSGSGSLVKNDAGTVTLAGSTPYSGNTTINSGRLVFQSPAVPVSASITNNAELEIRHSGAVLQLGTVIGGSGKLIKTGDGEVWLNAANTFSGDVEVVRGPVNSLNITHAQALGTTDGKTIVRGRNGNTGQHLNVRLLTGGGTTIAEPLEFHASALGRTGIRHEGANQTLTLSGPISVNSTGLAAVQIHNHLANSTLNLSGDITGTMNGGGIFLRGSTGPINITGGISLDFSEVIVTDSARITIGAAGKTYSGFRTNIAFGHLRTLVDNALDPAQVVNLGQNNADQEARLILGSGAAAVQQTVSAITVNNPAPTSGIFGGASAPSTLTLNMHRNTTIPLPIGGGGTNENNLNLVKTGPGVLTLSAALNSYTGTTTVSGGRLVVNGNTSASAYTISAGGTVGGTGTIGSVTASGSAAATANLSPADNGIGILTAFGTVNLGAHSALNTQLGNWNGVAGTGSDLLNVGNLTVTATAAEPVRIRLTGLNLQNFENEVRSFTLIQASGSITGFDPSKFVVDASALPQADGTWTVRQDEGRIVVDYTLPVVSGSPFEDWALARGLGADADPTADPDNDTVANLIEFVIGGEPNPANPDSNSLALLPTAVTTDDNLVFTFRLSAEAEELEAGAVYVQYSTGLATWETAAAGTDGITSSTVDHPTEDGIKLVTVTIPRALAGDDGRLFARLAAQLP